MAMPLDRSTAANIAPRAAARPAEKAKACRAATLAADAVVVTVGVLSAFAVPTTTDTGVVWAASAVKALIFFVAGIYSVAVVETAAATASKISSLRTTGPLSTVGGTRHPFHPSPRPRSVYGDGA